MTLPHLAQGSSNHKNLFLGASFRLCRTPKAALNFKSQLLQPLALCKLILSTPAFEAFESIGDNILFLFRVPLTEAGVHLLNIMCRMMAHYPREITTLTFLRIYAILCI
jgi:hypothetical protein